jgi:hypothetical protein
MSVKMQNWANDTVSVERGPLVYSLKIDEENSKVTEMAPDPNFPAWNKRPASQWNYALAAHDADAMHVVTRATSGCPWDTGNAPLALEAPAKQITNWGLANGGGNPGFPKEPRLTPNSTTITLVPYGSTCLRLTVFPTTAD